MISGVGEGINIRGWREFQYPGLERVSISGVGEGFNIRGWREFQYPGLVAGIYYKGDIGV